MSARRPIPARRMNPRRAESLHTRGRAARFGPGAFAVISLILFAATPAPAIEWHGVAELTTRWSRWDHRVLSTDLTPARTSGLQQRYQLGSSGSLYHPNVGSYIANISLVDDVARVNDEKSQDLVVKDYYLGFNFLPRQTPISLYAQRTTQDNEAFRPDTYGPVSVNTTYNLTWDFPLKRLPRLRLNLSQTDVQTDSRLASLSNATGQTTRAAALDTDGQAGNTRFFARYQLSELTGEVADNTSHTITASTDTKVTPALSAATRVNYSSNVTTIGSVTPGTLLQRSAGASVFYRPSLQTSLSGTYDYYKDPFVRHLAQGSAALRPLQELDISAGYRLARFDLRDSLTDSHYAFASANYRPFLGLSTNATASIGLTEVSGASDVRSLYQSYGYGANYLKTLTLVTYRLGYQGNYSENKLNTSAGTSRDLTNTFSAGLSNTQTRVVALSGDYALSLIRHRTAGTDASDQVDHRAQVTATSSAPQNLFLTGDFMVVSALASYAVTQYRTFSNHVLLLSATDTYETGRGVAATVGYTYEQQSQLDYDNKSTSFIQVRWLSYIVRNGSLDLNAKESWERYAGNQQDVTRTEGGALFSYYIGKLSLSADYRLTFETRTADRQLNQTAFAKASRSF
ncbi:MAG: hypothetical protein ACOYXR_01240 [Nitrospirota bacterium]